VAKRKFTVTFVVTVDVDVEQTIIDDALSDDFKEAFYDLKAATGVVEHLAYNHLRNRASLTQIDGFAQWSDGDASFSNESWDGDEVKSR